MWPSGLKHKSHGRSVCLSLPEGHPIGFLPSLSKICHASLAFVFFSTHQKRLCVILCSLLESRPEVNHWQIERSTALETSFSINHRIPRCPLQAAMSVCRIRRLKWEFIYRCWSYHNDFGTVRCDGRVLDNGSQALVFIERSALPAARKTCVVGVEEDCLTRISQTGRC